MKRVLSLLLVLMLVVGLVPMQAMAEASDVHNVIVNIKGNGTATATPAKAAAGETVTIDFEADEMSGHEFKEIIVTFPDGSTTYLNYFEREFTMPDGDVTVAVKFGPIGDGDDYDDDDYDNGGETEAYINYVYYTLSQTCLDFGVATATPGSRYQFVPLDGYVIDSVQVYDTYGASIAADSNHGVVVPAGGVSAVIWLTQAGSTDPLPQPTEYNITVATAENGTVAASAAKAKKDDVITVTATANDGYELVKITVTDAKGNEVTVADSKFTMPESDVTVAATFKATAPVPVEYVVTVAAPTNGKLSASAAKALKGDVITVTATADEGYELDKITVTDSKGNEVTVADGKFTMPESDVTVAATFKQKPVVTDGLTFNYAYDVYRTPTYPKKSVKFKVYNFSRPLDANGNRTNNAGTWTLTNVGTYGSFKNPSTTLKTVATNIAKEYGVNIANLPVHKLTLNGNFITYGILVMHNPTENVAFYIGSNYSGDGSGYLFANVTQSGSKEYDVIIDVTDNVPEQEKIQITFDANNGTCDTAARELVSGQRLGTLPTATRTNHVFVGWFTKDGAAVTATTVFTKDTTVYARWGSHTTVPSSNAFSADIDLSSKAILDMLLDDDDMAHGQDVRVFMLVEERNASTVPSSDHAAITAKAGNDKIAAYMDIQLLKEFSNGTREQIVNTKDQYVPITLKLTDALIPQNAVSNSFYILYHHVENGSATTGKLSATFDVATKTLSFKANQFSTYALAYTSYEVSFAANGGSGTMQKHIVPAGSYTLPTNGFTAPSGKEFSHWEVNGDTKNPGDTITISGNTTVTAIWKSKTTTGNLDNVPKTGDVSGLNVVTMLILFSAVALAGVAIYDKKRVR